MNTQTFVGNLTRDPELKVSTNGKTFAKLSLAVNEKQGEKDVAHYLDLTVWGAFAENVAESLHKGSRVIVQTRVNTYKQTVNVDGVDRERTMVGFTVSAIGPDLRFATAEVTKKAKADSSFDGPPEEQEAAPAPRQQATKSPAQKAAKAPARVAAAEVVVEDDGDLF